MVWADIEYKQEKFLPDQSKKETPDDVLFNKELYEFYKKLIHIRNEHQELQVGNFEIKLIDDTAEVYVFSRKLESRGIIKEIIVAINRGNQTKLVTLNTNHKEFYTDLLNPKRKVKVIKSGIVFNIKQLEGRILLRDYYRN